MLNQLTFFSLAAVCLLLAGCNAGGLNKTPKYPVGAGFVPRNVYKPYASLGLRRVVVLPPYDALARDDRRQDLDRNFATELGAAGRFEVVPLSRNELVALCGRDQVNSTEPLPPRLLAAVRGEYAAEAVMFVDITQDDPYRPITLGVRAKLVDARGGVPATLWSCDSVFNAGNPAVANSARRFQIEEGRREFPADQDGSSVLLSPARFSRYAANATFATLPQ